MIKEYIGADAERVTRIVQELSTENERLREELQTALIKIVALEVILEGTQTNVRSEDT